MTQIELKPDFIRIQGKNFIADVDLEMAIICAGERTYVLDLLKHLENFEDVVQVARALREQQGIKEPIE